MLVRINKSGDMKESKKVNRNKFNAPVPVFDNFDVNNPMATASIMRDSAKFRQITDLTAMLAAIK